MPTTHFAQPKRKDSTPSTHPEADLIEREVVCPAGLAMKENTSFPACHCRIEDAIVSSRYDPVSYKVWCTGDYTRCPTWRSNYKLNGSR